MAISATRLRQDIYRILDDILETGVPVEIIRKGRVLKITPTSQPKRLDRLTRRDCIAGDPEELVELDWSHEWRP